MKSKSGQSLICYGRFMLVFSLKLYMFVFSQTIIVGGVQAHHRKFAPALLPLMNNWSTGMAERWRRARGTVQVHVFSLYDSVCADRIHAVERDYVGW